MQKATAAYEPDDASALTLVDLAARRAKPPPDPASAEQIDRLLTAGIEIMRRNGTTRQPPVSEIVQEAGLSNAAFYKYFPTRDDLVAAIIEAGALRLVSYLDHQMGKFAKPEDKAAAWIKGFLAQASEPTAEATRAVHWNGRHLNDSHRHRMWPTGGPIAALLPPVLRQLGSADPDADATMIYFAVSGRQWDLLWRCEQPTSEIVEHTVRFCLASMVKLEPTRLPSSPHPPRGTSDKRTTIPRP